MAKTVYFMLTSPEFGSLKPILEFPIKQASVDIYVDQLNLAI